MSKRATSVRGHPTPAVVENLTKSTPAEDVPGQMTHPALGQFLTMTRLERTGHVLLPTNDHQRPMLTIKGARLLLLLARMEAGIVQPQCETKQHAWEAGFIEATTQKLTQSGLHVVAALKTALGNTDDQAVNLIRVVLDKLGRKPLPPIKSIAAVIDGFLSGESFPAVANEKSA